MSDSFTLTRRETLMTSFVFSVERRTISYLDQEFERDIAVHPGAVAVVAVNDRDQVALVRQYRAAVDRVLWEIPAGTIDTVDHDPLATAQRELLEEIGVRADEWSEIAHVYVSPGWTNQVMHVFLARQLTLGDRSPDGPEENAAQVEWFTRPQVRSLLDAGETNDATFTIGLRHYLELDGGA